LLFLASFVGIHRLRPRARFRVGASYRHSQPESRAKLLRKLCRPEHVSISSNVEKDYVFYEISSGSVRRDAAADVFLTDFIPEIAPRTAPSREKGVWNVGDVLAYPVKRLELILFVHQGVWPGCDFSVAAYDTAARGQVKLPDAERDSDRLSVEAPVVRSAATPEVLRASAVRDYTDILRGVIESAGWKLESAPGRPAFRIFRCEIAYPLYGAQIVLVHS
jgi:hypothetical protein